MYWRDRLTAAGWCGCSGITGTHLDGVLWWKRWYCTDILGFTDDAHAAGSGASWRQSGATQDAGANLHIHRTISV